MIKRSLRTRKTMKTRLAKGLSIFFSGIDRKRFQRNLHAMFFGQKRKMLIFV